jgi:hypothetical protein
MRSYRAVVIHNPGRFLMACELSEMDEDTMVRRFDGDTLLGFQETVLLEPTTTGRVAAAVELMK